MDKRGELINQEYVSGNRVELHFMLPLGEIVIDFYDKLKSISKGYASFDYHVDCFRPSRLVKLDILLNGEAVDALSTLTHFDNATTFGRRMCEKLKELIPRQQFDIAIQAAIGAKIVARETVKCLRKDVTAKCYGGDVSRKRKLLEKQKKGKKRMKQIGNVEVPQKAFLAVLKLENPPSNLTVASWGDSSKLKVGQPVMAVGNPLGLSDTVTTGIVSALNRPVTTQAVNDNNVDDTNFNSQRDSDVVVTSAIQTNAAINPGNSGGALVDSSGALVGITSSIASLASNGSSSGQSGNIGIGFAIPSTQVKSVVEQLIANGTVKHPQLGIRASNGTSGTQLGAKVEDVTQGSAAAQAGLQKGDLITAIDGTPVVGSESLVAQVRSYEVGKEVTLKVLRGSETLELKVTLGTAN